MATYSPRWISTTTIRATPWMSSVPIQAGTAGGEGGWEGEKGAHKAGDGGRGTQTGGGGGPTEHRGPGLQPGGAAGEPRGETTRPHPAADPGTARTKLSEKAMPPRCSTGHLLRASPSTLKITLARLGRPPRAFLLIRDFTIGVAAWAAGSAPPIGGGGGATRSLLRPPWPFPSPSQTRGHALVGTVQNILPERGLRIFGGDDIRVGLGFFFGPP